jgi:hypothetical protein
MNEEPIILCPNCNDPIIIEKINCGIFRHGIFKNSFKQIEPHSPKDVCDYYVEKDLIYGCGKPFQINIINNNINIECCDYI